jgi:ABC-type metal ion transport system substrate-binding protein
MKFSKKKETEERRTNELRVGRNSGKWGQITENVGNLSCDKAGVRLVVPAFTKSQCPNLCKDSVSNLSLPNRDSISSYSFSLKT